VKTFHNPTPSSATNGLPSLALPQGPLHVWARFWFSPVDPFGLHALRLLTGLVLLAWLLPLAGDVEAFFGLHGWFDRVAYVEAARLSDGPPKAISWSILYLCGGNATALQVVYWGSIAVLALFALGIGTRLTGVLSWVVVVSFTANPGFDDEVDPLLHLLALYLAVGYLLLGTRDPKLSWAQRLLGRWGTFGLPGLFPRREEEAPASIAANVAARLVQVHLAILLTTTALHKLQFGDWWSGMAYWYPLHPALGTQMDSLRALVPGASGYLGWLGAAAYATLAWQLAFPLFAWRGGLARVVLLAGALAGWVGADSLYRMPLFGPAFAVACLAFISPEEWATARAAVWRIWALGRTQAGCHGKPHEVVRTSSLTLGARER
jgi:hypothetical protein